MVKNQKDLSKAWTSKHRKSSPKCSNSRIDLQTTSDVKVFVRVRPFNERELNEQKRSTVKVVDDKMLVFDPKETEEQFFFHGQKQNIRDIAKKVNKEIEFVFNRVFPPEANNNDVFEKSTKKIISALLDGYNCSVFVYGATGAGKTYTMLGNKNQPGITYLTMVELYKQVEVLSETKNFHLGVSYIEVYNENVYDLLRPSSLLHLREDANGVTVAGLNVKAIHSAAELFELLEFGNRNRTQHPTDTNAESSRSHAVFQVYIRISNKNREETKLVKLSMIDLAGSERGMATGYSGLRFKEGSNINKSLLALGNCINSLAEGSKHIPYRNSKLTRLLKDSLGGNCQTIMIANVSPSPLSYEDTYNTLKYATRARKIKSRLSKNIVSVELHVEDYVRLVEELKRENAKLMDEIQTMKDAKMEAKPLTPDPQLEKNLSELFNEKKQLQCKLLLLESKHKVLEWRIHNKQMVAQDLNTVNIEEGFNVQGINKIKKSLRQLEARKASIRENIIENLQLYNKHNQEFQNFTAKMEESKSGYLLEKDMANKELQVATARQQIQISYLQKLVHMQNKELESYYSINSKLFCLNSKFFSLLRAHNHMTICMEAEYQSTIRSLEGVKNVTWTDIEENLEDDDGTTLNFTSVRPFINLTVLEQGVSEYTSEDIEGITKEEGNIEGDVNATYISDIPAMESLPTVKGENCKTVSSTSKFKVPKFQIRKTDLHKKENIYPFKNQTEKRLPKLSILPNTTSTNLGPRVPLKSLKMSRINSRMSRCFVPYTISKPTVNNSERKKWC